MPFSSLFNYENHLENDCASSSLATLVVSMDSETVNANTAVTKQINYSRYKTELCRQYSENGECKYGDKCQFAHGFNDLKDVNRHPKYKTDYCKTFHSKGFCPYGPRCHFIHEFYEKNTEINTNKTFKNKYDINMNKKLKQFKPIINQGQKMNKYSQINDFNDYRLTTATTIPKDDSSSSSSSSSTSVSSCLSCSSSLSSSSSSSSSSTSSSQSPSPSSNYSSSSSSLSLSTNRSNRSKLNQPLITDSNVLNYILGTRQEQETDLIELTRHLNLNCMSQSSPKTIQPLVTTANASFTLPEQQYQQQQQVYQVYNGLNLDEDDEYSFYYENNSNCQFELIKQR